MKKQSVHSALAGFAIAALVLAGTGMAYADTTTPADTSTDAVASPTDTAAPTTDPTSTADPAPTSDAAPTPDPAPTTASATTTSSASLTTSSPKRTSVTTSAAPTLTASVAPPDLCGSQVSPELVGTFEIDGNTCIDTSGKVDWGSYGAVSGMLYSFDDAKDSTAYTQGDSESSAPATWHTGGSSQGKDDITDAWSYTNVISGHVWTFFGVQRVSDNGTTTYDVELNHNANSPNDWNPNRTPASRPAPGDPLQGGDLLLQFSVNGTGPLTFDKAYQWTAKVDFNNDGTCFEADSIGFGWCPLNTVVPPSFESSHSTDGLFAEGAVDLSALAQANGQTCTGSFGWMNIRTVASESHTAALQDYVAPFPTNIASTCGSLTIEKRDENGVLTGGATFTISSDPRPGHSGPVTVRDGAGLPTAAPGTTAIADPDGTADGDITFSEANPGVSYTVTEISPPSSAYMIDNPLGIDTNPQSTSSGHPALFRFVDHHIWQGLSAEKSAQTSYGASYDWSVVKEISADGSTGWNSNTDETHPLVKSVPDNATDANKLFYRVKVEAVGPPSTSAYRVHGDITVTNPEGNVGPMTANVSDELADATCLVGHPGGEATLTDVNVTVDPNTSGVDNSVAVPYVCTFAGTPSEADMAGDNTAHVTWDRATYPQQPGDLAGGADFHVDPTHAYDFADATVAPTNKTVTVTDNRVTTQAPFDPSWTLDWDTVYAMTDHTAVSSVYSVTVASAGPHTCSSVVDNTVTVTGNGLDPNDTSDDHVFPTDSAYGQICEGSDLTATVSDTESLTRTYPWSVQKSTSTPTVQVVNGAASATYDITVTTGDGADSGWALGGTVTVTNPNDWEDVSLTGLTVGYSGSNDSDTSDDCTVSPSPGSVPAGDQVVFDYTCTFDQQPSYDGNVTADLSWDSAAITPHGAPTTTPGSPVAAADWAVSEVNATVTVHDDRAKGADDVMATLGHGAVNGKQGHREDITYTQDLTGLPAAGSCNTKVNTVWVVGNQVGGTAFRAAAGPNLDADGNAANNQASVEVCAPAVLPPIVSPPEQQHPNVLPNTGGPDGRLFPAGLALVLAGITLVAGDLRRKRRS